MIGKGKDESPFEGREVPRYKHSLVGEEEEVVVCQRHVHYLQLVNRCNHLRRDQLAASHNTAFVNLHKMNEGRGAWQDYVVW